MQKIYPLAKGPVPLKKNWKNFIQPWDVGGDPWRVIRTIKGPN